MSMGITRWLVLELLRPIVSVGNLVGRIYKFFFCDRDVRLSRVRDERFGEEIRRELPFLFDEYQGKIVPDQSAKYPRPFDYVGAIVATDDLFVRFLRGRGELRVHVAPKTAPEGWEEIHVILSIVGEKATPEPLFLTDVAILLKSHMAKLIEAFSDPTYPELRLRLSAIHEQEADVIRHWEKKTNRWLDG